MLKKEIKYKDFDGNDQVGTFYFNLSEPELIDLQYENEVGLDKILERIIEEKNQKKLIEYFKKIVLASYGIRSEDAQHFIKDEATTKLFTHSAAYIALYMELATDDKAAAEFIIGIAPAEFSDAIKDQQLKQARPTPPSPPSS